MNDLLQNNTSVVPNGDGSFSIQVKFLPPMGKRYSESDIQGFIGDLTQENDDAKTTIMENSSKIDQLQSLLSLLK